MLMRTSLFLLKRFMFAVVILSASAIGLSAQSLDDLNIQIHGYATQGFFYTTQNNIFTTESSNGSPAWTEAVINVTAQPDPKLRIGVQGRYQLFGNYANAITLDWAAADYKVNDRFGIRFGKVKTPSGLFNEIQDIDPSYMWTLLPQSVYPLASRNGQLSHYGGVVYGTFNFTHHFGQLEYRGWSGMVSLPSNDGYFTEGKETGTDFPNGVRFTANGAALHWKTPLPGLMIGVSDIKENTNSNQITVANGALSGTMTMQGLNHPDFFARYDKKKLMLAGEYTRAASHGVTQFPRLPGMSFAFDDRGLYGMGSYKFTDKFSAGIYHSYYWVPTTPVSAARYSKDWAVSARYDFNQFLYAKAEQHFIDGTAIGYDTLMNPKGLKPDTRLTVLKIGVSF